MSRILVIGAAAYQVPAIQRIRELGHVAYCVDYKEGQPGFAYADGHRIIDVRDKEGCLKYAQELGIDGVLTWGATLTLETASYVASAMSLPALPIETARIATNKYLIRKRLTEKGLNVGGEVFAIMGKEDVQNHEYQVPFVVKPCDGSGSKGVRIVTDEKDITAAIQYAFDGARNGEIYVEPYVAGEEFSVEAYVCNGAVFVYSIVKTSFEWKGIYPEYTQTTYLGISKAMEMAIKEEVMKAVKALNVTFGPINFDLIISDVNGKPYIIDIGIRNGQNLLASHIVPYSRGVDELNNSINLCLGHNIDANPKKKEYISSRLLIYAPGEITEIKPYKHLIGQNHIVDIILRKKSGDILPNYQTKSDICGWVLTSGSTPEDALRYSNDAWELLKEYIIIKHV